MTKKFTTKKLREEKSRKPVIDLPTGPIKVDITSVGTVSTASTSPQRIAEEFRKAAKKDLFISPALNG